MAEEVTEAIPVEVYAVPCDLKSHKACTCIINLLEFTRGRNDILSQAMRQGPYDLKSCQIVLQEVRAALAEVEIAKALLQQQLAELSGVPATNPLQA